MSDTTPPSGAASPGASSAPPALPLTMNLQYTKDLSFEVPAGAEIFATLRSNPQISVNIDVQANRLQQEQLVFEIVLAIKAEATEPAGDTGTAGRTVFIAELAYAAIVTLTDAPENMVEPILLVEVPRLIFPYARNIISEVTRDGGFPPVVLQPIDFVGLWQAKRGAALSNAAQVSTQTGHA